VCEAVSTGSWAIGRTISLGIPMWGFIPWVQLVKNTRSETLRPFGTIVAARKKLLAKKRAAAAAEGAVYEVEEQYDDCLTAMLSDESMSEKDMCDHFTTLVCAGHDTTAYFASYMCYLLSLHPVVQDKLVSEIQLHFQAREEVTADDITSLKYLTMVMHETLRVYSIIPQVRAGVKQLRHFLTCLLLWLSWLLWLLWLLLW
jgi:cytochrome P450